MSEWKELSSTAEIADAVAKGMAVEVMIMGKWYEWKCEDWAFRARTKQQATKTVKSLCWRCEEGGLLWGDLSNSTIYKRFPAGDIEGEVEA